MEFGHENQNTKKKYFAIFVCIYFALNQNDPQYSMVNVVSRFIT